MMTQTSSTYWVCVDCYYAHHGIDEHERGEAYPADVLSLIPDTAEVTAGLIADEHDESCPVFPLVDGVRGDYNGSAECDCETREFSWSRCDGCGSDLGGTRNALTVWSS